MGADNPYARRPLRVAHYDPRTGDVGHTTVLLGAVPASVARAARAAGRTAQHAAALKSWYGAKWRALLGPAPAPPPAGAKRGGDDADAAAFADIFADLDADEAALAAPRRQRAEEVVLSAPAAGAVEFSDYAAFPDDSLEDLRATIYAATGIAPYRQHLFWRRRGDPRFLTTHRLEVDGLPVLADIREMFAARGGDAVAGIPVDRRLEQGRESITVRPLDRARTLRGDVEVVYCADLFAVLPPVGAPGSPAGLAAAVADAYQADLLWYGGLLRYWPRLTREGFALAARSPERVPADYPAQHPPRREVQEAVRRAQEHLHRAGGGAAGLRYSVTAATLRVAPHSSAGVHANLRNVFDLLATSPARPAVAVRYTQAELCSRGLGDSQVALAKRHLSSFDPRAAGAYMEFLECARRAGKESRWMCPPNVFVALWPAAEREDQERRALLPAYVSFVLSADGAYEVTGAWHEEDRVTADAARARLAAAAAVVVGDINRLGAAALSGALAPPETGALSRVSCTFFAGEGKATAGNYRALREHWAAMAGTGLAAPRETQYGNIFAFRWRKGIAPPAPAAVTAALAAMAVVEGAAVNGYRHLMVPSAAARWDRLWRGRLVRLHHRLADFRVEILGAGGVGEVALIAAHVRAGVAAALAEARAARAAPEANRLRRLQEVDPDLYDLRKYDKHAKVYSTRCQSNRQGNRQPVVYTPEEADALPARDRKALTEYWNFTANTPAFYACPDRAFPALTFQTGHPRDWCLPCCKAAAAAVAAESRRARVEATCLENHAWTAEDEAADAEGARTRNILAYGKSVPDGRLGDLPRALAADLLGGTLPAGRAYRVVGVPQCNPRIPDPGLAYSVALALGVPLQGLLDRLSKYVAAEHAADYHMIGHGCGAMFSSPEELSSALLAPEKDASGEFTLFCPGGGAESQWSVIFIDLVRIVYGALVVVFRDTTPPDTPAARGSGVVLEIDPTIRAELQLARRRPEVAPRVVAVVSAAVRDTASGVQWKTYPVFAHDAAAHTLAAGATRVFDPAPVDAGGTTLVDVLIDMVGTATHFALTTVLAALDGTEFWVHTKLVNNRGECYGVLVTPRERAADPDPPEVAYVPVTDSYHRPGLPPGARTLYGPRPGRSDGATPEGPPAPRALQDAVLAVLRARCADEMQGALEPAAEVFDAEGRRVGFSTAPVAGAPAGLFYLHDPEGAAAEMPADALVVPYDPRAVDAAVHAVRGRRNADLPADVGEARARVDRLRAAYRLFAAEFAEALRGERDAGLRAEVKRAAARNPPVSVAAVRALGRDLQRALADHPDDAAALRRMAAAAYDDEAPDPGCWFAAAVDAAVFGFDRVTLRRLRAAGRAEIAAEVRRVMAAATVLRPAAAVPAPPNVYVACAGREPGDSPGEAAEGLRAHCDGARLVVDAAHFDAYVDILAADIANPLKADFLAQAGSGTLTETVFIRRENERLVLLS